MEAYSHQSHFDSVAVCVAGIRERGKQADCEVLALGKTSENDIGMYPKILTTRKNRERAFSLELLQFRFLAAAAEQAKFLGSEPAAKSSIAADRIDAKAAAPPATLLSTTRRKLKHLLKQWVRKGGHGGAP